MGLLFYIILNLYLVVTSRIADLVPGFVSLINPYLKIGAYKNNSRVSKNSVILRYRQVILLSLQAY